MPIITGTTVAWYLSPRVITIPVAYTDITIADLQETLLDLEDSEEGIVWPHLRETSGGEDLGGGVSVGLTMELQNAQIAFAPRTTQISSGTVTTPQAAGTLLTDSAATFITDGVLPGATIVNFTDQSVTSVIEIISETQMSCYALADGIDNQWDSSDVYKVWNEVECSVTGGNLVAVDTIGDPLTAIRPTFGTQITKTSSSSATTQSQTTLEQASYNNRVYYDPNNDTGNAVAGTNYPAGTATAPSNNITDAAVICTDIGFNVLEVLSTTATFDNTLSLNDFTIIGRNPSKTAITFTNATTEDMSIYDCTFSGSISGSLYANNCIVGTLTGLGSTASDSIFEHCLLEGNITLRADNNKRIDFVDTATATHNLIEFDINNTVGHISMLDYKCRLRLKNITTGIQVHVTGSGAEIRADSTCTSGTLELHGDINFIDEGHTLTIDDDSTQRLVWLNQIEGTYTAEEVIRIMAAALAGKASGLDVNNPVYRAIDDSKARIAATTDSNGNRSAVVVDGA